MSNRDKKQRKQKKRQERLRQQKHRLQSLPREQDNEEYNEYNDYDDFPDQIDDEHDLPPGVKQAMSGFAMERHLRDLHKVLEGKDFKNIDEVNAFLQSTIDRQNLCTDRGELTNNDRAQELAFQAMETNDPKEAVWRAKQAIELDPDCVDALVILATRMSDDLDDRIKGLEKTIAIGERTLGSDFFAKNTGHFWGITETRPYMRAREALAMHLTLVERHAEAKAHFEAMLKLNPGDNQGVRLPLLASYLVLRDLDGAKKLLKEFEDCMEAVLLWGKVLCDYLAGDISAAVETLKQARKENPYAEGYFTGKKPLPDSLPPGYSPGEKSEAVMCAFTLGVAWAKYPDAVRWLKSGGTNSDLRLLK